MLARRNHPTHPTSYPQLHHTRNAYDAGISQPYSYELSPYQDYEYFSSARAHEIHASSFDQQAWSGLRSPFPATPSSSSDACTCSHKTFSETNRHWMNGELSRAPVDPYYPGFNEALSSGQVTPCSVTYPVSSHESQYVFSPLGDTYTAPVTPLEQSIGYTPALSTTSSVSHEGYFDTLHEHLSPSLGFSTPGIPALSTTFELIDDVLRAEAPDFWDTDFSTLTSDKSSAGMVGLGLQFLDSDLAVRHESTVNVPVMAEECITPTLDDPRLIDEELYSEKSEVEASINEDDIRYRLSPHTSIKSPATRRKWTKEEDEALTRAVSLYTGTPQKWKRVAEVVLGGRTPKFCAKRWDYLEHTSIRGVKKGRWVPEEDVALSGAVMEWRAVHGAESSINWNKIAAQLPLQRSGPQAQARYTEKLDPAIKSGSWTGEEDGIIRQAVSEFGSSWLKVAERLPGRTQRQCRMRYFLIACQRENVITAQ